MGSFPQASVLKGPARDARPARPLHQLFSEAAKRARHTPAIIVPDGEEISFGSADSTSSRYARGLLSLARPEGNADGDRVVVVSLPPTSDLVLVLLAVWKAGAVYLPLEPSSPPHMVKHILNEAEPFLVITTKDDEHLFEEAKKTATIDDLREVAKGLEETSLTSDRSAAAGNKIEIILYTSGSTGLPKGVRIRNSSCLNRLEWGWREFPFSASERVCVFKTAVTSVDSVPELWGSLLAGRTLLLLPKPVVADPQQLVAALHKHKVERLILVPTLLRSILTYLNFSSERNDVLHKLKLWVCSGETLTMRLAYDFFKKFGEDKTLCNFYGSTEVMGDVTYYVMRSANEVAVNGKVPIGSPLDNTQIYLLDKDLKPVTAGSIGEIYVGGKHVAAGYVKGRDSLSFIHSPHPVDPDFNILFRTGDYGRMEKNLLLYEGRTDSQLKVRGHRVDLAEVEAALGGVKGVEKGAALCYKPVEADQEVLGFILLETDTKLDASQIQQSLKNSLPSYAIPQIVFIDSVPLLSNGKVDQQQLLRIYEKQSNEDFEVLDYSGIKPGNEKAAESLFKAVFSVLGQPSRRKISGMANFYHIGGNSLNSVLTIAKLKEAGYNIGISNFISAQNLAEIANEMALGHSGNGYHSQKEKYSLDFIDEKYKADVYRMIGDSFLTNNLCTIELAMDPPVKRSEYDILLDNLWPTLMKQKLSIVLKNRKAEVIGVSLFMDIADEPEVHLDSQLKYIFQFLEYLEVPLIENVLPEGKILHSFMLATDQKLNSQENIEVTEILERQIEEVGKSRGYEGIFTTNTSPLTQQLAESILNYKKLKTYQLNQFVAPDGSRPFKRGDDTLVAVCSFKRLICHQM